MPRKKRGLVSPIKYSLNPKEKGLVSEKVKKRGETALEEAAKAYKKKMKNRKWKIKY